MYHTPSHNSLVHKVYDYRYAAKIVEEFVIKYARATNFVAKILDVEPIQLKYALINTFSRNNNLWNILRDSIKRINNEHMYPEILALDAADKRKYLIYVKFMVTDDWLDNVKSSYSDLTRVKKSLKS